MSDDRTADLTWIDVHDDSDVWYWTHKFGVTKRKLVAAVREVGALSRALVICRAILIYASARWSNARLP